MQKIQHGFSLIELMIALSIGALLCTGIFNLFSTMENLHQRQMRISHEQENSRFITDFLREKIQMAGNWSCVSSKPKSDVVREYSVDQAKEKLDLKIKSDTKLLQLHECVRFHDKQYYLPIEFYVGDAARVTLQHNEITALFYKIANHRREELITGMTDFQVLLYPAPGHKKNIQAVRIDYVLSSIDDAVKWQRPYWFDGQWITPADFALYQPGILYVSRRDFLQ
ncbi:MAG: prepilin-type N-terminal cleavage/methylation domain-containing protein [Gammaproteobacteria bacterium]|nr:prepilin-type N-terminal cleavage/methylation domain-containing protein [Gammaproteobacteria bacterium]